MINPKITVPDLPETLRDIAGINNLVMDEMALTMRRAVDIGESSIVQYTPVGATGHLRQAWGTTVQRGTSAVKGTISNPLDYAPGVEKGQPAGTVADPDGLELWVRRKLGISPPQSRQVAFLIGRAIYRRGTKGQFMAQKGFAAVKGIILADFAGIPDRVATRANST